MGNKKVSYYKRQGLILLLAGLTLLSFSVYYKLHNTRRLWIDSEKLAYNALAENNRPTRVIIPSLGVNLDVVSSTIENGEWIVSEVAANHLDKSSVPGGGENIVVYAHNKASLFGPLKWISLGSVVQLVGPSGEIYEYEVYNIFETDRGNISVVLPAGREILTLYTCSGFIDTKRLIVQALLIS